LQEAKEEKTPPISIRLTAAERSQLAERAGDLGLSAYVRQQLFGTGQRKRVPRSPRTPTRDVAHLLALLGDAELAASLRELARAVRVGALPVLPGTEQAITDAGKAVIDMRSALIEALGLRGDSE
jgi:hypothetical protein